MSSRPLRRTSIAGLLAVGAALATTAEGKPLAPTPTGNAKGLALLARVHRAYVGVPAVALSGRAGSLSFRFTVVLSSGIADAEQFVSSGPSGTTTLVAPRGSPTFARDPRRSCWRRLAASDPQSFENIGLPFPDEPRMQVKAPRRTASGWLLPVVNEGEPGTFAIDAKSLLIRSLTISSRGGRVVEHVGALRSVPTLLVSEPRC